MSYYEQRDIRQDDYTDCLIEHFEYMEEFNKLLVYYESCVDLLQSIEERTAEENIKLKLYKSFISELKRLKERFL